MRIALATDAWAPQVNGVVTTLSRVTRALETAGHEVLLITPEGHRTVGMPTYREIRLAVAPYRQVAARLRAYRPDAVHIATEGPLGHAARRVCQRRGWPFTTAYHTQFPQYLRLRAPVPPRITYAWLRRFHGPAERTLVPTPSMLETLRGRGFRHLALWPRGVDTELFRPGAAAPAPWQRPISLYAGRVAREKNLEAFLALATPGTKVVVGDGPDRTLLARRYPDAVFTGYRQGDALASLIASADVFVFPSRTDTYGLSMLEAMACGVPVAAYPVTGPRDVVRDGETGALDTDLGRAIERARGLDPNACVAQARAHTWQGCAERLVEQLAPITHIRPAA